ncbi:MAG: D-hexose-6-phosphate mutarotase [Chthoniobacterales bacterium]|nr:D-hexose-6-phosphate mutarotase [Chthoniobacterales bacterium]
MNSHLLKKFSIPNKITLSQDAHGFWRAAVTTPLSTAEIYLQGAHVTAFQKKGEEPLLFMSASHRMDRAHMLHGGIPLCFPWFGNREAELLSHGFARINLWDLVETKELSENEVSLRFQLPHAVLIAAGWPPLTAELTVIVGGALTLELRVHNTTEEHFLYEECFHSYFLVSDISKATIHGLCGLTYLDKVEDLVAKVESFEALPIKGEINRIYLNSTGSLEIHDAGFQRIIRIEKTNSRSTVVWNPWKEKARTIPDFEANDYQKMLCVESGNIREFGCKLAPGEAATMQARLSTLRLITSY